MAENPKVKLEPLRFVPEPGTSLASEQEWIDSMKFYCSSMVDANARPLLCVISRKRGNGMRLNFEQAQELHAWLGEWIERNAA